MRLSLSTLGLALLLGVAAARKGKGKEGDRKVD